MKKFIILSLSFYSCFSFGATLSPYDLSVLAEERAPLIKAQIENKAVSESQISQSKLLPNPILTLQSGSIKSATQSGSVIDVTIGQPLPWPGRRDAQIDGARILGKVASMDVDQSRLVINHAATLLGIEWAILNELEKHNKKRRQRI